LTNDKEALVVPVQDTRTYTDAVIRLQDPTVRQHLGQAAHHTAKSHRVSDAGYVDRWIAAHPRT